MKPFNSALCAGIFTLGLAASIHAAPITDQSLIQVRQLENTFSNGHILNNFTTTNSSVSHTLDTTPGVGSTVQAHGSLVTGKTGTLASTSTHPDINNTASSVMLFDTLSFSSASPTNVSYGINFDGSIANLGVASTASTNIKIYDITGFSTWLTQTEISGPTDTFISSNAPVVSETSIDFFVGAQNLIDTFPPSTSFDQAIANTDGTVFNFDLNKTGTFIADPSKTYGISIWTQSLASGLGSSSDFLNTSAFSFTDLNGATFTSGSGAFLTAQAVSAPPVSALLGIGIFAGWICRRSRRSALIPLNGGT